MSSQLRHISTIGKKVKQQYLPHMFPQYGELWPTSGWDWFVSLLHPSEFQWVLLLGFITAAMSLNGSQPNITRRLAVSWSGTLYNYTFSRALAPLRNIATCKIYFASHKSCALILAALLHGTPAASSTKLCGVVQGMELRNFRRRHHLYSPGRPSRWASAHILGSALCVICFMHCCCTAITVL